MDINFKPNIKQYEFLSSFDDKKTTEILFGGAAGGGKSYVICANHIIQSLKYPGIRSLIGREELKNLKATTLQTFFKVASAWGLSPTRDYNYNKTDSTITFSNGSVILLRDLKYLPSDPECTFLGSLEITFASIDEAGEIHKRVKEVLHSRCGRWKNNHYNISPKLFMSCNPSRNFLYDQFYKPSLDDSLPPHRKFIQSLITDHKDKFGDFDPKEYANHLRNTLSESDYNRLVLGNWDFDDDPNAVTNFQAIQNAFIENEMDKDGFQDETPYITADIAFESDRCVAIVWKNRTVEKIHIIEREDKPEDKIKELLAAHGVVPKNICYDATGAGMYLKNYFRGSYAFHSGAKPIKGEKYEHLKTQVYFYLAQAFNEGTIKILDDTYKSEIIDECLQIRVIPKEKIEAKVKMIKKEEIKKYIGRSPDILDALAMRFVWEIRGGFVSCI